VIGKGGKRVLVDDPSGRSSCSSPPEPGEIELPTGSSGRAIGAAHLKREGT
jgi:hypothetical protein